MQGFCTAPYISYVCSYDITTQKQQSWKERVSRNIVCIIYNVCGCAKILPKKYILDQKWTPPPLPPLPSPPHTSFCNAPGTLHPLTWKSTRNSVAGIQCRVVLWHPPQIKKKWNLGPWKLWFPVFWQAVLNNEDNDEWWHASIRQWLRFYTRYIVNGVRRLWKLFWWSK